MEKTDMILKFGWLGWRGDLSDIDSLFDWLYKEFGLDLEEEQPGTFKLIFQSRILCKYFGVRSREEIIDRILPDTLLLWKCEDGKLEGPSLENYEEPNTDWT